MIEYYGRDIGVKIMPTGVNPDRFLNGFTSDDTLWRRSELLSQVCDQKLQACNQCRCKHNTCSAANLRTATPACSLMSTGSNADALGKQTKLVAEHALTQQAHTQQSAFCLKDIKAGQQWDRVAYTEQC